MRKVKCKICGKELTNDTAYKITNEKTNKYYCSKDEYDNFEKQKQEEKNKKKEFYETIAKYLRFNFLPPMAIKELNILKDYSYNVIERCFQENEKTINWFLDNNEDVSDFGKCRYIFTIIQNNINNTYKKWKKEQEEMKKLFEKETNEVDINIMNMEQNKPIKKKNDIHDVSSFFDFD